MNICSSFPKFSYFELTLWTTSVAVIAAGFLIGGKSDLLALTASLVGATSLIFIAKANVIGQILMIAFSIIYAVISYKVHYYGEMITYLGMNLPIALFSVVIWLKHPYDERGSEVEIAHLSLKSISIMLMAGCGVTIAFYFILGYFNTARLIVSTLSVFTSFISAWLLMLRSSTYALAYAANDVVLIVLWILACIIDISCLPMVICFIIFLINDLYGFYNWRKMKIRQSFGTTESLKSISK